MLAGKAFSYRFSAFQFGDAVLVTCGGEPDSWLQEEFQRHRNLTRSDPRYR